VNNIELVRIQYLPFYDLTNTAWKVIDLARNSRKNTVNRLIKYNYSLKLIHRNKIFRT
jgi:hypothetical protein